ncbi:hypothetical protein FGG08_004538 [Glutinoglossum americanum]|uniref:Amino acid permease/ SLC12A domain-containing protein n=1 Tax=Glutinoglossum americanum TaxID=1670608 RepID=A0A9P8I4V8_9PEZI|nr:hypothetical protein FGG08_004538 [Glutinoglossum americanum]
MAEAGFFGLAHASNGFFIFATWSCALSNMYSASRILYSLAANRYMPKFGGLRGKLATTTSRGVPLNSIIACTLFGFLGFLSIGKKPQAQLKALDALSRVGTIFWSITFLGLSITFIRYYHFLEDRVPAAPPRDPRVDREFGEGAAREAANNSIPNGAVDIGNIQLAPLEIEDIQPVPLEIYAYKSHFQPYRSWVGIIATSLFIIFGGWWVFVGKGNRFQWDRFISCYIANLVFVLLWGGVKVWNWVAGGGPPRLRPDTARIDVNTFLTAKLEEHEELNGVGHKLKKFAKKIWWWIY